MAFENVHFEVTSKDGVQAFWIAVGNSDVNLVDGKGSIPLDDSKKQTLVWWFVGDAGGSIAIVGTVLEKKVVEVKESAIPDGETEAAGYEGFVLT